MFELKYPISTDGFPPHEVGEELLPLIDGQGNVLGRITRAEAHGGTKPLHPVVHVHFYGHDEASGELLLCLQKRSMQKDIQPGKWDTAVGGHVDYGETLARAAARELGEELCIPWIEADGSVGMNAIGRGCFEPFGMQYIWESDVERELVSVFFAEVSPHLIVKMWNEMVEERDEVDDLRAWPLSEIEASLGQGVFTPQFEQELPRILPLLMSPSASAPACRAAGR